MNNFVSIIFRISFCNRFNNVVKCLLILGITLLFSLSYNVISQQDVIASILSETLKTPLNNRHTNTYKRIKNKLNNLMPPKNLKDAKGR